MKLFMSGALPAATLLTIVAAPLQAATVTGTGAGVNGATLEAQASFDISGDFLTITLQNIATDDEETGGQDTLGNTLTGLFFFGKGNRG